MTRKIVTDRKILKGHTEIHPALDFYDDKAMIAVARPGVTTFDDKSISIEQYSICITSDGDSFILTPQELLDRKLFYLKDLDLALDLWEIEDQEQFIVQINNGHKPKVSLREIHNRLKEIYIALLDFTDIKLYDFFPCFIIYTYFFPLFSSAPVVHLWGPAGSGKTKIIEILAMTCFNPITSGNITEAGIFRLVEGRRGVCLLDESEDLSKTDRGRAIVNLILNGYRGKSPVFRMDAKVKQNIVSSHYDIFSPKVIANITGIDREALISRAIRIVTSNTRNSSKANHHATEYKKEAIAIRNQLYRACLTKHTDVTHSKDNLPQVDIKGRSAEIWQGILSIAWLLGEDIWHNVVWLAIESSKAIEKELVMSNPTWDLLEALLDFVRSPKPKFYTNEELHIYLSRTKGETFGGKRQITQMLKLQGFQATERRVNGRVCRGMVLDRETILERLNYIVGAQFEK